METVRFLRDFEHTIHRYITFELGLSPKILIYKNDYLSVNEIIYALSCLTDIFSKTNSKNPKTVSEAFEISEGFYGYPLTPMEGGEVLVDGTYRFNGDPDLLPMASMIIGDNIVVNFYSYGIVSICSDDEVIVVRMD